jgi:hypothetical protein
MRVLIVHPGVDFSVSDVHDGWLKGFRNLGCDVTSYNMHDRIAFFQNLHWADSGKNLAAQAIIDHASLGLHGKLYEWWPDLIVFISGFFVHPFTWDLLKHRPHRTALVLTECPYEDDKQMELVGRAEPDLVVLNDPQNIGRYRAVHDNVVYIPHGYDPTVHYPGVRSGRDLDFVFVGTGFQDRIDLFHNIDWTGLSFKLAGNWPHLENTQLSPFLVHPPGECVENEDAADLYRRAKVSANRYRREANRPELEAGWAIGPREVELAATETFFCRDPRGEGDELFPMLPTFTDSGELEEQIRWWSSHSRQREKAARVARDRIVNRTFDTNVKRLLRLVGD